MTATMAPAIEGIKTFRFVPVHGMSYLSVNLARVDAIELIEIAKTGPISGGVSGEWWG
jgi:hypothetical protein